MPFTAKTSIIPPTPGNNKMLWSPELFDEATGAYPKVPHPAVCSYPKSSGQIQFFEGYYGARTWPIAFGAATDLTDPEKLYDEQDATIVTGNEAASLFTFANYIAIKSGGPSPISAASEANNYDFTKGLETFYTGEISFASGMIIDPHYYLVYSAELESQTYTFITEAGGMMGGTYGGSCNLFIEISKDTGTTWDLFDTLGTVNAYGPINTGDELLTVAKTTINKIITGATNLLKLRFRIVAEVEGVSVYHVNGTGPGWTWVQDLSSNIITDLFGLFLEGTRYPLNPLEITTGGDLLGIASTLTHEQSLWALGKLTYGISISHESFSGSQNGGGQDVYDNTYPCPGTPSSKLVIDSTIYDIESFAWDSIENTTQIGPDPVATGFGILLTTQTAIIITLVGHPDLSAILSIAKEVYWI